MCNIYLSVHLSQCLRCFLGGDLRLNLHGGLAALQTMLVHEHNRIASILSELNPQWGDDTIFEESRAVVSAQLQHITYREFLPVLLGARVSHRVPGCGAGWIP